MFFSNCKIRKCIIIALKAMCRTIMNSEILYIVMVVCFLRFSFFSTKED